MRKLEEGGDSSHDQIHSQRGVPAGEVVLKVKLDNRVTFAVKESSLPCTIGRNADSDICLPLGRISRHHCQLYLTDGVCYLRDTSTNGTYVGDQLVRQGSVALVEPTTLLLGNTITLTVIPQGHRMDQRMDERHLG